MWNVITAFTSLWFMITKGMLAPLWAHKPHIHAHPLTARAHFKVWTNCKPLPVNNPSLRHHETPSGSSLMLVIHFLSGINSVLANAVFTPGEGRPVSTQACSSHPELHLSNSHLPLLSVCLLKARQITAKYILLWLRIAWLVLSLIILHLVSPDIYTHTHRKTNMYRL